jgi:hypothetical protein
VLDDEQRLTVSHTNRLGIDISVSRRRIGQFLGDLDGFTRNLLTPFSVVDDLVHIRKRVPSVLASLQDSHSDFDKRVAGLRGLVSQGRLEFFRRPNRRRGHTHNNLIVFVGDIADGRIHTVEPRPIKVVSGGVNFPNDPAPVEACPFVETGSRVGQVNLRANLRIRNYGFRRTRGKTVNRNRGRQRK